MKRREHDERADHCGDKGSNYGMGKMKQTPEGFSDSEIKSGHKKMGKPAMTDGGRVKK